MRGRTWVNPCLSAVRHYQRANFSFYTKSKDDIREIFRSNPTSISAVCGKERALDLRCRRLQSTSTMTATSSPHHGSLGLFADSRSALLHHRLTRAVMGRRLMICNLPAASSPRPDPIETRSSHSSGGTKDAATIASGDGSCVGNPSCRF